MGASLCWCVLYIGDCEGVVKETVVRYDAESGRWGGAGIFVWIVEINRTISVSPRQWLYRGDSRRKQSLRCILHDDIRPNTAAGGEFGQNFHGAGLGDGDQIIEDEIGDVLVKGPVVAIFLQVEF